VAELEERCDAAPGATRRVGVYRGLVLAGLAAAAVLARAPATAAQDQAGGPGGQGGQAGGAGGAGAPVAPGGPGGFAGGPAQGGAGGVAGAPPWLIVPAIDLSEQATDNVRLVATGRQADLITTVSPSIFASGSSARLQGNFSYSPQVLKYATATDQDQILQNLFGTGTLTAVQDLLFFDANASISNQSRLGGRGFGNTSQIPTSSSTQTIAYSGAPYAKFHFGDTGDAVVRYQYSETMFSGNTGPVASLTPGQTLGSLSNSTQNEGSAKFTTGEAFNLMQLSFALDYQRFDSATSSRDESANVSGTYQLTRTLQQLASIGYERLTYSQSISQSTAPNFGGATWSIGYKYQPREDREVMLNYGKSQGQNSFSGNANWAVTPLTTISASYSEQTETQQQELLQNIAQGTQTVPGQIVNQQTGLPLSIANPNLALQNGVFRIKTLQAGASIQGGERNHYTITLNRTEQDSPTTGTSASNTTSNGGYLTWSRDLSPYSTGALSAGYSTTSNPGATGIGTTIGTTTGTSGSVDAITFTASYNYNFTETLSGNASYSLQRQSGGGGGAVMSDIIAVSLHKTF
jgi:uncharacterized protein (PEP-CTERM system associated)